VVASSISRFSASEAPIPKRQGAERGFATPIATTGITADWSVGISEWRLSFLTLAATLKGCYKRYERFCQKYRHHSKGALKCHWGSRMLKRLVEASCSKSCKSKRISPGQTQLPFAFDIRLNHILDDWYELAVRFRRANGIRDGDGELCMR
jgi:hypothetical protein